MPFYAFIQALFRSLSYVERQKMTRVKSTPRKRFYHIRDRFLHTNSPTWPWGDLETHLQLTTSFTFE